MYVSDAGRTRRHPLRLLLFELQEIEIKSTVRNLFGACERFLRNGEQRKARRQRQRFLRASEHHVDPERVHVDFHTGERRDRIDDQHDIGILRENRADFLQRIHHTS